ncbi:unnamed protein product (macronuclear) [Paramecium tetraurelia]|uniref:Ubiquitin-like domain-containing protein n=1 Tax=Paramecium tetraurelia TaxID=5888 RepID=A0C2F9_PARTE|nr:uncharacterized protein GSPATT00034454001 [Paramecium tetraurelia]CAK64976.1 unnamed protein product [Paramecium tetraurelia]|eukprot:XP_001432373.1 hypothetical protein (macronuclear) [Paramecium tetraurelia strain d4-2]
MPSLQFEVIINACQKLSLTFGDQVSVEQIANKIIETQKFPRQSNYRIEIDQAIREPSYILNCQPISIIKANFNFMATVIFVGQFNTSFEHRIDLCKQIQQISNEIMNEILPIEYSVYILQNGQNANNLYINSYEQIPKLIEFEIQANFYINFQGIHYQQKIHPLAQIEQIKYQINEVFCFDSEFQLWYRDTELNDQSQYITYLIPDHSELKIKLPTRIKLLIKYKDTVHQFSCALEEKLGSFKQRLKQVYHVSEKHPLQLMYKNNELRNDQESIQKLKFIENAIIEMQVGIKYSLTLQNKESQEKFQFQARSTDLVSVLDKQHPFINKQVIYEFNGHKLKKEETFEQLQVDTEYITIYFQIEKQKINVQFQDDFAKHKIEVITSDPIRNALQKFNQGNDPISITYGGKNISIDSTYEKEAIVNDSIIVYKINNGIQIKYTVAPNCVEHTYLVPKDTKGSQLLKALSQIYSNQGQKYKLMLNSQEFPADQPVIKDQCYRLVRIFEMQFSYDKDERTYIDLFSQEDKIFEARKKMAQVFNLPFDSVFLLFKDCALKDDTLINQCKDKTLVVSQAIHISFQKRNGSVAIQKYYLKQEKFKYIFKDFLKEYQISQCRFEFNNQIVDENNLLKDICKDEQSIVLIYEFQYNLKLVNKEMQNEIIKVSFYPSEIIGSVFKRYLSEKFSYLYNGQLVDIQKQFEVLRIQNNSKVYYFQFHNFTLEILKTNTKLQIQIDSLNYKIIDAISPKMKEHTQDKFTALYNNRELDLQKTFLQEKVMSGATIQCQLPTYLQVIIHDNEFDKSFNVHPNICIGQILAMMMDSNPNKKMLSYKDQKQLENDIIVSKLQNNNGIIELIYKELISTPDTIYQPSGSVSTFFNQTQDLKTTESSQINIVIININNDDKIFETVKLDQKIGDFLKEFEIKNEFSSINIFYEGAVVDYDKTFEEIGANPGSLFEII